jgi:hypothetical protein
MVAGASEPREGACPEVWNLQNLQNLLCISPSSALYSLYPAKTTLNSTLHWLDMSYIYTLAYPLLFLLSPSHSSCTVTINGWLRYVNHVTLLLHSMRSAAGQWTTTTLPLDERYFNHTFFHDSCSYFTELQNFMCTCTCTIHSTHPAAALPYSHLISHFVQEFKRKHKKGK